MNSENKQRNPVLLVNGIHDTGAVFNRIAFYLRPRGWSAHTLDLLPNNGAVVLDQLAHQVADYVTATFKPQQALDLVGFSMGQLSAVITFKD
jgi:triacylglycerol lipase